MTAKEFLIPWNASMKLGDCVSRDGEWLVRAHAFGAVALADESDESSFEKQVDLSFFRTLRSLICVLVHRSQLRNTAFNAAWCPTQSNSASC